jgi:hypothetical protein
MRPAVTIFVIVIAFCCGCTSMSKMTSHQQPEVKIELRFLLASMTGQVSSLAERHVSLKILNTTNHEIKLDRRLLSVVILVDLYDETGARLGNFPPSIPQALQQDDVVIIKPGEFWGNEFRLDQVTGVELNGTKYRIQACYDSQTMEYPVELGIWRGKACSNTIEGGR